MIALFYPHNHTLFRVPHVRHPLFPIKYNNITLFYDALFAQSFRHFINVETRTGSDVRRRTKFFILILAASPIRHLIKWHEISRKETVFCSDTQLIKKKR